LPDPELPDAGDIRADDEPPYPDSRDDELRKDTPQNDDPEKRQAEPEALRTAPTPEVLEEMPSS
jgi:hypothetical protein